MDNIRLVRVNTACPKVFAEAFFGIEDIDVAYIFPI